MSLGYEEGNRTVDLTFCEGNVLYPKYEMIFSRENLGTQPVS